MKYETYICTHEWEIIAEVFEFEKYFRGEYEHDIRLRLYREAWEGNIPPHHRLEFHRNGLIHNAKIYGKGSDKKIAIGTYKENALLTLRFAHWAYSQIGYFGSCVILMVIENTQEAYISGDRTDLGLVSLSDEVKVERESNSWELLNNHQEIVSSMMDELMNFFGFYKYLW